MFKILYHLIAIQRQAKEIHYRAKGFEFYSDHLLADRIYDGIEDLIDEISKTEEILKKDVYYKYMTLETKGLYRSVITQRTKKTSEYDYACQILERSNKSGKHIGFYLLKGRKNLDKTRF